MSIGSSLTDAQEAQLGKRLADLMGTTGSRAAMVAFLDEIAAVIAGEVPTGSISTAELADGILSADAAGRLKTAAGYFDTATLIAKIATGALDATVFTDIFAANAITNADIAKFADGFLAADATSRAKIADLFVTDAKLAASLDLTGKTIYTPTLLEDQVADGAIGARRMVAIDAAGDHVEGSLALAYSIVGINSEDTALVGTDPLLLGIVGPAVGIAGCPVKAGRNLKVCDGGRVCQLIDALTAGDTIDTGVGIGFTNQPANDGVTIVSSDAGDTTQTVTIIGTTQATDDVVTEEIALNGVVAANSVKVDWGFILAVKMDGVAVGTVTVSETSGGLAITTMAPAAVQSGVVTVPTVDQGAHNGIPDAVADGATTKTVGIQYTQNDGATVAYQAEALNGATAVDFPTAALLVTELYVGDLEGARTVTVSVEADEDAGTLKVGKSRTEAAARDAVVSLTLAT